MREPGDRPADDTQRWENLGERPHPSWYLDPLVAAQKKLANQNLIRNWNDGRSVTAVLKTDLFEEAHGDDHILFDLFPKIRRLIGIDIAEATVRRARRRDAATEAVLVVTDVRQLALADRTVDLVVSNSTLDHFDTASEFYQAVGELTRVMRPGGTLVITVDNPRNPLYLLLRWISRRGWVPFPMGYSPTSGGLVRCLESEGLEVTATGTVIHNPRLISTALFLLLRRLLRRHADMPIRLLLRLFALGERLPTRWITACFVAACARKPSP